MFKTFRWKPGPLAGDILWAEDNQGPPALLNTFNNLVRDHLSHRPVSCVNATPEEETETFMSLPRDSFPKDTMISPVTRVVLAFKIVPQLLSKIFLVVRE